MDTEAGAAPKPRLRPHGDRGTSLAELSVAMLVVGLLAVFLATTAVQTARLTRTSTVREIAAQRASLVVAQVTRDLRSAVPVAVPSGSGGTVLSAFTAAQPHSVSFFSSATPDVLRARLFFATSPTGPACTPTTTAPTCRLWRETQRPDAGRVHPALTFTDPTRTRVAPVVPADLPHTVSFSYRLKDAPTAVTSVSTLVGWQSVVAVQVRVSVDGDGAGGVAPVVLQSTVRPYNR